jgi:hypothetical protein
LPPEEPLPHVKLYHPAAGTAGPSEPLDKHAFVGNTAQPGSLNSLTTDGQPDWAAPYGLVPQDPMSESGASTSEFGSAPVTRAPEEASGNFSQGHIMQPPADITTAPVDNARDAVASAIAAAPFDPAFGAPVQSLNAQPLNAQPLHPQDAPTAPPLPAMQNSDTPMLVLPTDNASSVTATQPIATQDNPAQTTVPPPVPPPLMAAPGAIIPTPPRQ